MRWLLCLCLASSLFADGLKELPPWAQEVSQQVGDTKAPEAAEAWVLYMGLEYSYSGGGEIRIRRRTVSRVLTDDGTSVGTFAREDAQRRAGIKRLKGWNLRPDGKVTTLDKSDLWAYDADRGEDVTENVGQFARLTAVVKGSLVVFESEEVSRSVGPIALESVLGPYPIRNFELLPRGSGSYFSFQKGSPIHLTLQNFAPWLPEPAVGSQELHFKDLPGLPYRERGIPSRRECNPLVWVHYEDPEMGNLPQPGSWDALAKWYSAKTQPLLKAPWPLEQVSKDPAIALPALHKWLVNGFRYQIAYLSPARNWVPEQAAEVQRKRYGDCKDLAICFLGTGAAGGFQGFPVMARIYDGRIRPAEPAHASAFNHVITAIKLNTSLGLPAEVDTEVGRLLLVDCTAQFTPLGWLPEAHRGGRVMVCTPEKALWVTVPDQAIEVADTSFSIKADVLGGRLKGLLTVKERGNARGFRSWALHGKAKAMPEHVAQYLDLPVAAKVSLLEMGDPQDLSKPFEASFALETPDPIRRNGSEFRLMDLGFPGPPDLIQPKGQARILPVAVERTPGWTLDIDLGLDGLPLAPLSAGNTLENPFRKVIWTSSMEKGRLHLRLQQETRSASWDFEHREEGVSAQKRDRTAMKNLIEDARTLVEKP